MDEEKLTVLVQEPECWYTLQHEDFEDDMVKDKRWKEIAREIHAKCKERAAQYYFHYKKVY
jgi:hypothetical protein